MSEEAGNQNRLIEVVLDDASIAKATPDVEHERAVAIFDLIEENSFKPVGDTGGPYKLVLSVVDSKLIFDIARENDEKVVMHVLSLSPFRKVIKDYFLICESYYDAIRTSSPTQIILDDVRARGDEALFEYTTKFDRLDLTADTMRVSVDELSQATASIDAKTLAALQLAHDRIKSHHARQMPKDDRYTDSIGVELGSRWTAIEAVGLYVPGGTASYPSSVLMNAVPAKVAGVPRIVMVVPTPDGIITPLVLAAAQMAGVDEIYRVGGAQAVAALAFGTKTISPVAKIVGPGNAFVAEAKRQVFGTVGIDMIAGPSEVLVIADEENDPDWVAADLLAQAEHDESAQSILITDNAEFGSRVEEAVAAQLKTLPRTEIASQSWKEFGAVIVVENMKQAAMLADQIAAEHLEIMTEDPDAVFANIRNAGAVFLGRYTPEAIGDYVGGSNHVLPTSRSARFSSGLSVLDYVKRTSILRCGPEQLHAIGPAAEAIATIEGLEAHRKSVAIRSNAKN